MLFGVSRLSTSTANASSLSLNRLRCNVYHDATQRTFPHAGIEIILTYPLSFFPFLLLGYAGCLDFKIDYSLFLSPCENSCISGIAIIPNHTSTRDLTTHR